ncbi:MAG: glutamate-1-semialdehyde 2,1-aminomutase [Burkholderiales bacterium]
MTAHRVHRKIPGGSHTYSKGDDQFPQTAPRTIARGEGYRLWDEEGRVFIDWTMGLASVSLGHAYPPVVEAAKSWLGRGSNFARPTALEEELADQFLAIVPCAQMVKFGKHGSDGTSSAIRLARAFTGRDRVLACSDNPFYSVHDWWIGTTECRAGIPEGVRGLTHTFPFGDLKALDALLDRYGKETACIIVEPAATIPPELQGGCSRCAGSGPVTRPGCPIESFWKQSQARARAVGALFVLDENKTGFRMAVPGAETFYGLEPDMTCYGKAMANGFSVSALAGRADVLDQGGIFQTDRDRVFLLSATHGGETHALAAALKTVEIMRKEPVTQTMWRIGDQLTTAFNAAAKRAGLADRFVMQGYGCFPTLRVQSNGTPDAVLRSLFVQEMAARGILCNFIVPAYVHDESAVKETIVAAKGALKVCAEAIATGNVQDRLLGPPLRPVFRRRN